MYAVPDVEEVVAVAKSLGIHLGADEAALYRKYLLEQLDEADKFVQARIEEPTPPMCSAARTPACRPSAAEDPLNAWLWKCSIKGEADGRLAGKTVSYKDHIAVAGVPTCLTTAPKNHRPSSYLEAVEDNLTAITRSASQNTQPLNYTGHPALAMPVGKSSAGLPASMQIIGRFFDDPLVLRVAYAYQHSVDWDAMIAVAP